MNKQSNIPLVPSFMVGRSENIHFVGVCAPRPEVARWRIELAAESHRPTPDTVLNDSEPDGFSIGRIDGILQRDVASQSNIKNLT